LTRGKRFAFEPEARGEAAPRVKGRREDDLSERLIRKATSGQDEDIMDQVTSLMADAQNRLVRDLDTGPKTQAVQQRILQSLDDAIQMALQQRSRATARSTSTGERREMPKKSQEQRIGQEGEEAETPEPGAAASEGTGPPSDAARQGPFREVRRGWGHLPGRDRDELLQGIEEQFIEHYRPQIEQYYRALSETEEDQ